MICSTCNRPAAAPYRNEAAGEGCVDSIHDAHLDARELSDVKGTRRIIAEMGLNLDAVFAEARERSAAGLEVELDGAGIAPLS